MFIKFLELAVYASSLWNTKRCTCVRQHLCLHESPEGGQTVVHTEYTNPKITWLSAEERPRVLEEF